MNTEQRRAANAARMRRQRSDPNYRAAENQRRKQQRAEQVKTAEQKAAAVARTTAWRANKKAEAAAAETRQAEQVSKTSTATLDGWAGKQPKRRQKYPRKQKSTP